MLLTQITPRGQITLPAEVRKLLGLQPGTAVEISVEGNRVVVQPVITLPLRIYSDEELAMFEESQQMAPSDLKDALKRWGVSEQA